MTTHLDGYEQDLVAALDKARAALKRKATSDNVKAAETARKALDAYRAEKAAAADPEARRFKTLAPEVLEYLKAEGWKVEKTKLYDDRNKINREPDGAWTKKAVDEYACRALERLDGSDKLFVEEARRKTSLEIDILEEKKKEIVRENEIEDGKWILRSE